MVPSAPTCCWIVDRLSTSTAACRHRFCANDSRRTTKPLRAGAGPRPRWNDRDFGSTEALPLYLAPQPRFECSADGARSSSGCASELQDLLQNGQRGSRCAGQAAARSAARVGMAGRVLRRIGGVSHAGLRAWCRAFARVACRLKADRDTLPPPLPFKGGSAQVADADCFEVRALANSNLAPPQPPSRGAAPRPALSTRARHGQAASCGCCVLTPRALRRVFAGWSSAWSRPIRVTPGCRCRRRRPVSRRRPPPPSSPPPSIIRPGLGRGREGAAGSAARGRA